MNGIINTARNDKIIYVCMITSFVLLFISIIGIGLSYRNLPPFLPLYNQMPWGEARLGKTYELFIPVLFGALVLMINLYIAHVLYATIPLLSRILSITSALIWSLIILFVVRTILVVL